MTRSISRSIHSSHRFGLVGAGPAVLAIACLLAASLSQAQQPGVGQAVVPAAAASHVKSPSKAASSASRVANGSSWAELTPAQQQSLKPLQGQWNSLTEAHKRKWLVMSTNYPTMSAPEQARVHTRMTEWATLSAKERSDARLNFAEVGRHSTDEKQAKWQAYQQLSPEEKQKLAAGKPKAQGAAPAVKPVSPQKMAVVPLAKNDIKKHPSIAGADRKSVG